MIQSERKKGAANGGVVGGWTMLVELLMTLAFIASRIGYADALHASGMCVQLGQANANHLLHDSYKDKRRMGPWTIGTRKFDIIYDFLDYGCGWYEKCYQQGDLNQTCPYKKVADPDYPDYLLADACVDQRTVELRTFAVKQDGKVMNGWLHFELELKDKKDKIIAVYVQVRDEFYNAIGEFVSDPKEQCKPSNENLTQPSEYQILPCSAVGFREAKVSNAIFMAIRDAYKKPDEAEKYIPKKSIERGIHFTWRLSEYWCNRHLRFRPEATIFTKKMLAAGRAKPPLIYRKAASYWLQPRWYGIADIKLRTTNLTCTEQVIDYSGNGELNKTSDGKLVAPWLHDKGVPSVLGNDYFATSQTYDDKTVIAAGVQTIKSCQWNTRLQEPIGTDTERNKQEQKEFAIDKGPTFAGRCTHHYEKTPSHDALQGCSLDISAPEFKDILAAYPQLQTYKTFVEVLTHNRTSLCSVECKVPTAADLTEIQSFKDRSNEDKFTQIVKYHSASRNESKIEKLIVGRKYHALLCTVWTMFLTPLGIFSARYFKETCMNVTCTGAHFWFWVHIATAVGASAVFVSSLSGIWYNLETWGRNQNAGGVAHRRIGYLSITLFFLMMILGGLRPSPIIKRIITMTAHSVMGFLIYFFNILAMISSFYIPGSPTIGNCDEKGFSSKHSPALYPIIIWVIIDIGLHISMTVMQLMKDKTVGLRRPWYCPMIPILPYDSADDFVGSSVRKITLMVYAGTAFILASTTIGLILDGPGDKTCADKTGNSSCHSRWGCSASALEFSEKVNNTRITNGSYTSQQFY